MTYLAPDGQEWINEEAYRGFIEKKPKKQKYKYSSPHRKAVRGVCEKCKKRKAVIKNYREQKLCLNCNLDIIEKWK